MRKKWDLPITKNPAHDIRFPAPGLPREERLSSRDFVNLSKELESLRNRYIASVCSGRCRDRAGCEGSQVGEASRTSGQVCHSTSPDNAGSWRHHQGLCEGRRARRLNLRGSLAASRLHHGSRRPGRGSRPHQGSVGAPRPADHRRLCAPCQCLQGSLRERIFVGDSPNENGRGVPRPLSSR